MPILLQFKESLSKELNVEIGSLCLIFAGRILKDAETLKSYGTPQRLINLHPFQLFVSCRYQRWRDCPPCC